MTPLARVYIPLLAGIMESRAPKFLDYSYYKIINNDRIVIFILDYHLDFAFYPS